MKPIIIITIAIILLVPISAFGQLKHVNELYDYNIMPPENWDAYQNLEGAGGIIYQSVFTPSNIMKNTPTPPQVMISYENVGEQDNPFISNEELLDGYNELIRIYVPSAKIISDDIERKSWGWLITQESVQSHIYYTDYYPYSESLTVHGVQYSAHFFDGDVYLIGFTADPDGYEQFHHVAKKSLETFEAKGVSVFEKESIIPTNSGGGGCLIATATYGSELAPEVQKLRELRDNSLLSTESGTNFMNSFNEMYYSFSPIIADYERENPVFKEIVKLAITPMITSLSILNYVDMDSESSVLGYGISLIVLNGMMYVGIPILAVMRFRR
jgi:hypothetical protein